MSERSSTELLIDDIFGGAASLTRDGQVVTGEGRLDGSPISIIGMLDQAYIGADAAVAMAGAILQIVREKPGQPILIVVDNSGHRLGRWDELVGNNGCVAHLTKCIYLARRRGHRVISLVNELAVSAGFMALGMSTDACYALPQTELRVMAIPAMSRVTKIPLDRLTELCATSPVLGPGAENFLRIGAIRAIWDGNLTDHLKQALREPAGPANTTRVLGDERGGRSAARAVAELVRSGAGVGLG